MSTHLSFASFMLCVALAATARAGEHVPLDPVEGIYEQGEWRYQLVILNQGLEARRSVGTLTFRGKEVVGSAYARIATQLGPFQWAGYDWESERIGWYRIDPAKKYARWTRVRIDTSKGGVVGTVIKE
jgi:hypothetical protein